MAISQKSLDILFKMQRSELTEHYIYAKIARRTKDENNRKILEQISAEELGHSRIWQRYTQKEAKPRKFTIWMYSVIAKVFGITFALKLMEKGEDRANSSYDELAEEVPEAKRIAEDEEKHEAELLEMLDEERLHYVGSMVLGLNDALVELTGTLAGLTFALMNTQLVALSGLITGISATFSMASSEFLSARSEGRTDAFKSCAYTGVAYLITVALLILPYLALPNEGYLIALIAMLVIVVAIIALFNFYIAVAKGQSFKKRFGEMAVISISVAVLSFVVGLLAKELLGVDI